MGKTLDERVIYLESRLETTEKALAVSILKAAALRERVNIAVHQLNNITFAVAEIGGYDDEEFELPDHEHDPTLN